MGIGRGLDRGRRWEVIQGDDTCWSSQVALSTRLPREKPVSPEDCVKLYYPPTADVSNSKKSMI